MDARLLDTGWWSRDEPDWTPQLTLEPWKAPNWNVFRTSNYSNRYIGRRLVNFPVPGLVPSRSQPETLAAGSVLFRV